MRLFDIFKKKENNLGKEETNINTAITNNISSASKIDLRKKTLGISLEKKSMQNTQARVALVIDESGSMEDLYFNNTIQETIEKLLPVAIKLDDNSELDVWTFNRGFKRMKSVTEKDFHNYVNKTLMKDITWGGTSYSPVINDVIKRYTKEEPSDTPTLVIFITDGENDDRELAKKSIIEASKYNIFWQFIGIGDENFKFLNQLDTMKGRKIDNANFFEINNINNISDEKLYDMLLNEYPSWEKQAKEIGIIW